MQQNSKISEQKYIEAVSIAADPELAPSGGSEYSIPLVETELRYERCLNRIGQRLTDAVTASLIPSAAQDLSQAPVALFQNVAEE